MCVGLMLVAGYKNGEQLPKHLSAAYGCSCRKPLWGFINTVLLLEACSGSFVQALCPLTPTLQSSSGESQPCNMLLLLLLLLPLPLLLLLLLQVPFRELLRSGLFVVLSTASAVGPALLISLFSYEFPTLIGESSVAAASDMRLFLLTHVQADQPLQLRVPHTHWLVVCGSS
jgi:hypothetical protein